MPSTLHTLFFNKKCQVGKYAYNCVVENRVLHVVYFFKKKTSTWYIFAIHARLYASRGDTHGAYNLLALMTLVMSTCLVIGSVLPHTTHPPKHCRVVTKVVCMWDIMKPNATGETLLQKKKAIKLSWAKMYASCRRAPHCLHPPSHCLHPRPSLLFVESR